MSFDRKKPPIRASIVKEDFNKLIELLSRNEKRDINKDIARSIKKDLLTYSIPMLDEDREVIIVRFFPREAMQLISQLLCSYENIESTIDYYEVVVKIRENKRKQNKEEH